MIERVTQSRVTFFVLLVVLATTILGSLTFGSVELSTKSVLACLMANCQSPLEEAIIFELRLPRVLLALVAGGGLALAGTMLQNATNNALADPYLFGIVAGAGLGAIVYSASGIDLGGVGLTLFAFIGALLSVLMLVVIVSVKQIRRTEHIVLAGVAVSFLMASVSQFWLYMAEPLAANRVIFWLMGSVAYAHLDNVLLIAFVVLTISVLSWFMSHHVDALLLGDEQAKSLGVDVDKLRIGLMVLSALLTAVIVAFCGGIGFVGLMIPHIARWLGFVSFRALIPAVLFLGGVFLIVVDVIARSLFENVEIPLGVITSALGSVFFFMLLKNRSKL